MNKKLHKRLVKNNAISLICYDIIPSDVWQVFTKWRNKPGIKVNVAQFVHMKQRVYQIEFICNDLTILEDDLKNIDPRYLKKISWLKRIRNKFSHGRQNN
ncbi:MAG: hypothetical protein ACFFDY_01220 [Candidatus Thorarchaeota archaeon]